MSRESNDQYKEGRLINGFDYVNQAWVTEGRYQTCGHPETMTCDCYGRQHHGETTQPGRLDGSEPETEGQQLEGFLNALPLTPVDGSKPPEPTTGKREGTFNQRVCLECGNATTECACPTEKVKAFDRFVNETEKEQAREVIKEVSANTALGKGARIALHDLTEKEKAFDHAEIERHADKVRTTNAPDILTGPTFSQYYTQRREQLRADLDHMVRIISTPGQDTPDNLRHRLVLIARLAELDTARESIGFDGYPHQDEETKSYFDPLAGEHDPR